MSNSQSKQLKSLPWDVVEKAITKEIKWLQETILEAFYKNEKDYCKDCIYRRIAILIVSGRIKVKDIKSSISLWGEDKLSLNSKQHGKEWHSEMMSLIYNHFKSQGNEVTMEPNLNMGRADLGVYKKDTRNLFIEIGTISLPKLLFNLESMEGSDFLLVLDSKHAIEFSILKAGYRYQAIVYE